MTYPWLIFNKRKYGLIKLMENGLLIRYAYQHFKSLIITYTKIPTKFPKFSIFTNKSTIYFIHRGGNYLKNCVLIFWEGFC